MLACPDWCELTEHDQCEQLRYLTHWKHLVDVGADNRVGVSVCRSGCGADPKGRMSIGELIEGWATLTVEQAVTLIQALQDAIDIVAEQAAS